MSWAGSTVQGDKALPMPMGRGPRTLLEQGPLPARLAGVLPCTQEELRYLQRLVSSAPLTSGSSGMGAYHGKHSFDTFSHQRP